MDVALEQQNPPIDLPEVPGGPALAPTQNPSVLFFSLWLFKKCCPQTTDCMACRPAP
jgi:hypothetical protein